MSKLTIMPNSIDMIKNTMESVDAYIIGIENMSVNLPCYFPMEKIKEIIELLNKNNKEIFISINKNMHNSDLDYLKEILLELNNYHITGVIYYDISIVNLKEELHLKYDLVWGQEHLTTNYDTCNYWYRFGSKYVLLSSELTMNEIIDIKKNSKALVMTTLFGYLPMFVSKRHLVKNYLDTFGLKSEDNMHLIEKEGNSYPIIDDNNGTLVYSSNILNGVSEYTELNNYVDYVILNSFNINSDKFNEVIKMFKSINDSNKNEYEDNINNMFANTNKGFLYTETVYKVKKNDK